MSDGLDKAREFASKYNQRENISILAPYLNEIIFLRNEGFKYERILQFLQETYGVTVGMTTLVSFYTRAIKRKNISNTSQVEIKQKKQKENILKNTVEIKPAEPIKANEIFSSKQKKTKPAKQAEVGGLFDV